MIDQPTIDRILDAAQIVDVVSDFVSLRKRGVNYVGLCPFHDDKSPSFYVSPSKGLCKCFSCGKGGNAVHFVMEHEQMSYPEALKWLAKKYHIEVAERELTQQQKDDQSIRESLFVVNEFARNYFQNILYNHADGKAIAMTYFRQRGIRDDIVKKFQLGFSTSSHDALAKEAVQKGYRKEFLVKTGLCYEREDGSIRDRFWGRVIFPVHTVMGKVVAFGGRTLSSEKKIAKYVNSPESEIYHKSNELYGIYFAKQAMMKQEKCYLVEGYMDVIAMHQSGIENVVASSGTALTQGQIKLIHRFTTNVTILYDGDQAGIAASFKAIDLLLAEGLDIKLLLLPDGDDPDSYAKKHGSTALKEYLETHEENFVRFKIKRLAQGVQNDPLKRAMLIEDMAKSIGLIPNDIVRYAYLKECAMMLNVDERIIQNEIKKHLLRRDDARKESLFKEQKQPSTPAPYPTDMPPPMGVDDEPAPPSQQAAQTNYHSYIPQEGKEKMLFYAKEQALVQTIIRHGEKIMCYIEDEEGGEHPLSVMGYIVESLKQDELQFHDALHRFIFTEAEKRMSEASFVAERYFLSHPQAEVSKLAADMISDRYQLSKYHSKSQKLITDEERLHELVPRQVIDFKLAILDEEMRHTVQSLSDPAISNDPVRCQEVMTHYKELSELLKEMAKQAGDRVILKA
ncbi:MAG: DNA primase [Phocaeicola sp.]